MSSSRSLIHRIRRAAVLGLGLLVFGAWLLVLRPQALGGPAAYITVAGTSMEPTLWAGDLVVMTKADIYERGDVVAYRVPDGDPAAGRHVIHRVIGGSQADGYVLQGDNTDAADRWRPTEDDIVGKQLLAVPSLGSVLMFAQSPGTLAGLAAALIVFWLPVWKESRPQPQAAEQSETNVVNLAPARLVKLNEALLLSPTRAGQAQVLVEFRNDGRGWAEVSLSDSTFVTIDDSGSITSRGHFSSAHPLLLAPGETGYMVGDVPGVELDQRTLARVRSAPAYRDVRQWTTPVAPGGGQRLRTGLRG